MLFRNLASYNRIRSGFRQLSRSVSNILSIFYNLCLVFPAHQSRCRCCAKMLTVHIPTSNADTHYPVLQRRHGADPRLWGRVATGSHRHDRRRRLLRTYISCIRCQKNALFRATLIYKKRFRAAGGGEDSGVGRSGTLSRRLR